MKELLVKSQDKITMKELLFSLNKQPNPIDQLTASACATYIKSILFKIYSEAHYAIRFFERQDHILIPIEENFPATSMSAVQFKELTGLSLKPYLKTLSQSQITQDLCRFLAIDQDTKEITVLLLPFESEQEINHHFVLLFYPIDKDYQLNIDDMEMLEQCIQLAKNIWMKSQSNIKNSSLQRSLYTLLKIQNATSLIMDLKLLCAMVINLCLENTGAEGALIIAEENDSFIPLTEWECNIELLLHHKLPESHMSLYDSLTEKSKIVHFYMEDLALYKLDMPNHSPIYSLLSNPILFQEKRLGYIVLINKLQHNEKAEFNLNDISFLEMISYQLANAINNAQLTSKIQNIQTLHRNILTSIRTGLITTDLQYNVQFTNQGACHILSVKEADTLNQNLFSVLPIPDIEQKKFFLQDVFDYIMEYTTVNNEKKMLNLNSVSLNDEKEQKVGNVIYFEDITEILLLQKQIQRSETLAALGEFSATIAHEIKNPLTSILGFTKLLKNKKEDENFINKYLKIVPSEVERVNSIIEELLAFANPKKEDRKHCSVKELVSLSLHLLEIELSKREITVDVSGLKDFTIEVSTNHLKQVFMNLFLNAAQAISQNGMIKVYTEAQNIHNKESQTDKEFVVIHIIDSGGGIPEEKIEQIFKPFYTTKERGTGLGLSITQRLIEEHDGKIQVENDEGLGAHFKLFFPIV